MVTENVFALLGKFLLSWRSWKVQMASLFLINSAFASWVAMVMEGMAPTTHHSWHKNSLDFTAQDPYDEGLKLSRRKYPTIVPGQRLTVIRWLRRFSSWQSRVWCPSVDTLNFKTVLSPYRQGIYLKCCMRFKSLSCDLVVQSVTIFWVRRRSTIV